MLIDGLQYCNWSREIFEDMRAATVRHLYSNPDVWAHFGYQGPSAHLGGYINRGFDDIPWVPDDGSIDE